MSTVSDESATRLFGEFCVAGLWPGVGRAMAEKLQAAGITSPDDVTAGRLELVEGVGPKRAARLAAAFTRAQPAYETAGLLISCRVPARFAGQAVALLGPLAADQLREDPWKLLTLPPIKPEQADWFARQLLAEGATPQDPRRGRALVVHLLNKASRDGHTAAPAEAVLTALGRFGIGDPGSAVVAAIDDGSVLPFEARPVAGADEVAEADKVAEADEAGEELAEELVGPGTLLALTQYAIAEDAVAEGLQRLTATAEPLPGSGDPMDAVTDAELDEKQHAAVAAVAEHGVSVLTGGPGTGKSRTVAAVVALAAQRGLRVALAAPTGRAAKRLEELAGAPATTLHRLLGAQGQGMARSGGDGQGAPDNLFSDGQAPAGAASPFGEASGGREGTWVFARGEEWPLDAELVVVDESSMLDVELAAALIEACADGTRLLLVGDPA